MIDRKDHYLTSKRIVQFTQLGKFGRFGNQIFQYLFARAYAEKYNAELELPYWIGEKIFKNVSHKRPSIKLPSTPVDNLNFGDVNIDLLGYFQKKEFIDILSEKKIREWLQFQDVWINLFNNPIYLHPVVAHLRRGDYVSLYSNIFCIVSKDSYLKALNKFGISSENIVWLSEETQGYNILFDQDLQFMSDFFTMINAKILLRSNSTFSFWAGFFNKNKIYSPVVKGLKGMNDVDFIEGNYPSIVYVNDDFIFRK